MARNRMMARLFLREDLETELADWLSETGKAGIDTVFRVAAGLVKILKFAGIADRDEQGRTLAVHALRHTTATLLRRAKVPPAVSQRIMGIATSSSRCRSIPTFKTS